MKGASEIVLETCKDVHYWNEEDGAGAIKPMTPELKADINSAIAGMAKETLRTLCIAYKKTPHQDQGTMVSDKFGVYPLENEGFTLLCVTGIRDILRPTVSDSVRKCQIAGIKVRMVTGDNQITAEAIAQECGIIKDHGTPGYKTAEHVYLGKQFWAAIGGVVKEEVKNKKGEIQKDKEGNPLTHDIL